MKKIVPLIFAAVTLQATTAQVYSNTFSNAGTNVINLTNFRQGAQFITNSMGLPSNVEGSVYFEDGYQLATVSVLNSDQPQTGAYVTYDLYNNVMMMSESADGKDAFALSQARNIQVAFKNNTFIFMDLKLDGNELSTYVDILAKNTNGHLLGVTRTKSIFEDNTPVSSYSTPKPPRLKMNTKYLIVEKNGNAIQVENNKKGFYKNIESKYHDQIKDFIKTNKVKFDEDLSGMSETFKYYTTLIKM